MDYSFESTMDFTQDDTIDIFTNSQSDIENGSQKNRTKPENVFLDSSSKPMDKSKKAKIDLISKEEVNLIDFPVDVDFIKPKQKSDLSKMDRKEMKNLEKFNQFSLVLHRLQIDKYQKQIAPKVKQKAGRKKGKALKTIQTKPITEDIANYARSRTRSTIKEQEIILFDEPILVPPKRRKSAPIHREPTPVLTIPDSTVNEPSTLIEERVEADVEKSPLVQDEPLSVETIATPGNIPKDEKVEPKDKISSSFYAEEDIINIQISPLYLSENQSFLENCDSDSASQRDTPHKDKKEVKQSPGQKVSPPSGSKKSQSRRSPSRSSKRSPKRSPSRKGSTRWDSPDRTRSPRTSPGRKPSPKRPSTLKVSPQRSPSRKKSPRRSPSRKSPLRSPTRKSPRRSPLRKGSPRRSPGRRSSPRRFSPRRSSPRRSSPRRSSPRRGSPRRMSPRRGRSPYRKSPSESSRRTPPRRSPTRRSSPRRSPQRGRSYSPSRRNDRRSPGRRSPIRRSSPRRYSPSRHSSRSPYRASSPRRSSPKSPVLGPPRNNPPHNPLHNYRIPRRSPNRYQDNDPSRNMRRSPIVYSRFSDRSKSPVWSHGPTKTTSDYERNRNVSPRRDNPPRSDFTAKQPERIIQHKTQPIKKIIRMESPVPMSISPEPSTQEDDGDTWRIVSRSSAKSRVNLGPNRPRSRSGSPNHRSVHVHDEFFDSDSGSPLQHESLHREINRSYSPKHGEHLDSNRMQFVSYNYNPYLDDPNYSKGKKVSSMVADDLSILENMFSTEGESQPQPQPEPEPQVDPEPKVYLPTEHYLPKDIPMPLYRDSDKDPIHLPFSERSVKCPLCKSVLFAKRYELHIREKCMQRHKLNPQGKEVKLDQNREKSNPASSTTSGSADPYVLSQVTAVEVRPFKCPDKMCEYIGRIVNIRQHYIENHMFMVCFNCNLRIMDPNSFPHHLSQCHNRTPAVCHLCSNHYPLTNSFSLGLHIVKDHNTETCSICQQSVSLRNFPIHMKRCLFNSQHRFRCPTCTSSIRIDNVAHHFLTQHFRDVCAICKRFTTAKKIIHVSRCFLDAAYLNIKNTQAETMVKCTLCSIQTTFYDIASHILKEHPHTRCIFCEGIFTVKEFATHIGICCQRHEGMPISNSPQSKRPAIVSYPSPLVAQMPPVMYPTFNYPSNPHMIHSKGFVSPPIVQTPNIFRTPQPRIFPSQYGIRKSYSN